MTMYLVHAFRVPLSQKNEREFPFSHQDGK